MISSETVSIRLPQLSAEGDAAQRNEHPRYHGYQHHKNVSCYHVRGAKTEGQSF
ncbi:hypothetical protein DPMN_154154 [Dreissena polymorpha]|uniref:Uncharacterized protein n=1 Tax=Dreissena polymorpha TaxID=45954 RepID=A0A9D4FM32_DREPO|nr:hypothetical protein DPMN_154154 [Dreissena polymorpha]